MVHLTKFYYTLKKSKYFSLFFLQNWQLYPSFELHYRSEKIQLSSSYDRLGEIMVAKGRRGNSTEPPHRRDIHILPTRRAMDVVQRARLGRRISLIGGIRK